MVLQIQANDGQSFALDDKLARASSVFRELLEIFPDELSQVNCDAATLTKVIEWLEAHQDEPEMGEDEEDALRERDFGEWDKAFFNLSFADLSDLMNAANYLGIKNLFAYTAKAIAGILSDKTEEEMRELIGQEDDD